MLAPDASTFTCGRLRGAKYFREFVHNAAAPAGGVGLPSLSARKVAFIVVNL